MTDLARPLVPRLEPLPRAGLRSVDELRHLAHERKSHAVFTLLWQGDVPLQAVAMEPLVLAQTVRGAINHYAAVEAHPDEVARLLALGEEALAQLAATGPSPGEPFVRASADWADFLLAREAFSRSRATSARALARGPERFPALRFELTLAHAAAQLALGEVAPAASALEDLARRPWLYPQRDAGAMARLTQLRARAALLLGQPEHHRALCWDVLSLPGLDDDRRLGSVKALARSAGGWWRSFDPGVPAPGLSARAQYAAWLGHLGLSRVKAWRSLGLARLSAKGAHAASNGLTRVRGVLELREQVRKRQGQRGVLVTRAMGGLGDLLMMTPGLHALARRHRNERVTFAIPLGFHSLFAGDPAFDLADIEDRSLTPDGFRAWHDLTDCPASRVESRTAPNVTRSRIELFAEGMGIPPHELDRAGRRPRYRVSDEERTQARREVLGFRRHGRLVAVQLQCAETYRDAPHLPRVIERLSRLHDVVLIDGQRAHGYDGLRLLRFDGRGIREALAVLGECDLLVAPDSAMVHFAAALDVPTLLLAGPIDGRVRSRDYSRCEWLDARADLGCVPCWRNGNDLCHLTQSPTSACMVALSAEAIVERVQRILER